MSHASPRQDTAPDAVKAASDGSLTYQSYLKVSELTSIQEPVKRPQAHDELLFIVVHQVYELWFKQILFELAAARDAMLAGRLRDAHHYFKRVHAIERLLIAQVPILESMRIDDYCEFRDSLIPASGFQSIQFRELEAISGRKEPRHLRMATPDERDRLERRLEEPTLWDAFCVAMEAAGLPMPIDDGDVRIASLLALVTDREAHPQLEDLAEDLIEHDELILHWRLRHILLVERQIGTKQGTGGSSGADYLKSTVVHLYPDLWTMRTVYEPS